VTTNELVVIVAEKAKSKNSGIADWPADERPHEHRLIFNTFFQLMRDGQVKTFAAQMDVILDQEERVE
jgi:hypothetical protein